MSIPIPQPPTIPFIGNVTSLEKEVPLRSFHLLAETYGEIYQLNILGRTVVVVSSYELGNEVSDETRFKRRLTGGMTEVRNLVNDGLFTSYGDPDEPNWGIAHRLLMPVFGPLQIKEMMEEMRDIASQLLLKWERFGPEAVIDPSDDFTRLTLDTISYCAMSHRLNSFYSENPPEFVVAMGDFLRESGLRANRPRVLQALMPGTTTKYEQDIKKMKDLAGKIVATRKTHPMPKKDLLDAMLNSRDPQTGQAMTDRSITDNLLTFLIAGHETTSGMMTFMVYYLLKNPEALRKLRTEVDEVLGDRPVQYEDFGKLKYLTAVMRETLRLSAPLPTRPTAPLEDTTLGGGKYAVKAGTIISLLTWKIQTDPHIWGDDAEEFRPERMLDGKFEALPPNAWQPFGYGVRACIGRAFAWQEVLLVMSSLIQKFDLSFVDPSYVMNLKQTLTVKPYSLRIRATPRTAPIHLHASPSSALLPNRGSDLSAPLQITSSGMLPLYVLYGSNSGTSEAFAQRVANDAPSYGFRPSIGTLDSALDKVPTNGPVVIITASFEGEPADNAARFIDWLRHLEGNKLENVRFAVFGCGNSDWNATFQKIPILCDELLEKHGGSRLVPRGAGDARSANFFQTFDDFEANLWATLSKEYSTSRSEAQTLQVKTVDAGKERAVVLRQADSLLGRVVENRVLTKEGPVKRHIEFELPVGAVARAGDYVAILPQNPIRDVRRVLARFSLSNEEEVVLSSAGPTNLPLDKPVKLSELLSGYVELSQPATTRDVGILIAAATTEGTRAYLEQLKASYVDSVLEKRLSVFQILEGHPDIDFSIGAFLQMLPSMRVRQYSISSSPLWNPGHITITISVLDAPSYSGDGTHPFLGVGSNYLASLIPGDRVQMAVRPSAAAFGLPENPKIPVVMFCSGSGLAPMRGFIQERATQKATGRDVGEMLLFFGCRSPDMDFLYSDSDLAEWEKNGVVDVRPAFSRSPENSEGCKYIQHRVWNDKADVVDAFRKDAVFFVCGGSHAAKRVKETLVEIIKSTQGIDTAEAGEKFEKMTKGRYATDVFD
ncbi:fatty acid hydroxylase [Mycena rebaudengoi]|nr:fatty acid hydroxylase [Mycena rebaudengoi]